jgi:hypothetical protein
VHPADVQLALAWAGARWRTPLALLLELDGQLAGLLARTREPQLAAIRLAWWRDQLDPISQGPEPADPLLRGLRGQLAAFATPAALGDLAEAWVLLASGGELAEHGQLRGGGLFAALGGEACRAAGEAWGRTQAGMTGEAPSRTMIRELRRNCLPLAVLAMLARSDALRKEEGRAIFGPLRRMVLALGVALKR